jgi:hypothetical protein
VYNIEMDLKTGRREMYLHDSKYVLVAASCGQEIDVRIPQDAENFLTAQLLTP